jgi:acyl-CoA synthetase (AMP-forming)/AMP-acid ligase II
MSYSGTFVQTKENYPYLFTHRVVLVFPPSLDFLIAFIACLKAGMISVPVFPPNPNRKDSILMFSKIVDSAKAKVALTNKMYNHMKKLSSRCHSCVP